MNDKETVSGTVNSQASPDRRRMFRRLVGLAAMGGLATLLLGRPANDVLPGGLTPVNAQTTGTIWYTNSTGFTNTIEGDSSGTNSVGVYGSDTSTYPGSAGVQGTSTNGTGVYGTSTNGYGGAFSGLIAAITASGKVGIGTGTPSQLLHVVGNAVNTGTGLAENLRLESSTTSEVGLGLNNLNTGGHLWQIESTGGSATEGQGKLGFYDNTTHAWRMIIDGSGNVGVGTTTPASPLNVIGPAFEEIQFLKSGGTQPSRLHATGDGINRFAVNMGYDGANFNLDNTADNGVSFLINSNPAASGIFAVQYIPAGSNPATSRIASNYLFMTANGNVGLSRVPTANNLEVEGNASKATAGSWLANSDMRIKTDIEDIDDALATIRKLHPVRFRYTDEYRAKHPSIQGHPYYNFIAQEYREVFPDSVQDDGTGLLQVDTYNATPYLVKAMQEQQREIEQLKTENKAIIEENKLMREEMKTLQYTVKRLAAS